MFSVSAWVFFRTPNNNLLMSSLPRQRLGVGSSFLSIVRSLGNAVGAALAATLVSAQLVVVTGQTSLQNLGGHLGTEDGTLVLAAFLQGFHYTYLMAAVLCLVGAALSAFACLIDSAKKGHDHPLAVCGKLYLAAAQKDPRAAL